LGQIVPVQIEQLFPNSLSARVLNVPRMAEAAS
jgi:hypothetical protein